MVTPWGTGRVWVAREEGAGKDRAWSPRAFRKTLPGSMGRRDGGKGVEAFAAGNILRWPPRCPPGPGVRTLYNLLPLSMGRTVNMLG